MKGIELKEIRKKLGITQKELAKMLNVNARTIQKWENGEVEIRKNNAFMIRERIKGAFDGGVNINTNHQAGDNIVGGRESELLDLIRKKDEQIAEKDKQIETLLEIIKNK